MNFTLAIKNMFWDLRWDLCWHSLIFFMITVAGYFAIAGTLHWLFFLRTGSKFSAEVSQRPSAANLWKSVRSDVVLSVWSSAIFAICASVMTMAYTLGYTRLYLDPAQHSTGYLAFSLVLVIFLQDTYFYFTHRLAHHPKCYRWLHKGHHHSNNPTPWTAFAFDPGEAMLQAIYLMGAVCLIPMHISVLCAVVLVMSLGALIHHFSLRLFQASAFGNWLGSWMVGPTHHWYHHRKYNVHYSLYFTFWDHLLGTQVKNYADILSPPVVEMTDSKTVTLTAVKGSSSKTIPFPTPFRKAS